MSEEIKRSLTTADGRVFELQDVKDAPAFSKMMSAADQISEALQIVGLDKKQAKILVSEEFFERFLDDRKKDGKRPECRLYGIKIEPVGDLK